MFATSLDPGTYEFTYSIRASLPGTFLTLPSPRRRCTSRRCGGAVPAGSSW